MRKRGGQQSDQAASWARRCAAALLGVIWLAACTNASTPEDPPSATAAPATDAATTEAAPTPQPQGPVAPLAEPTTMREVREDGLVWERLAYGERPLARRQRDEVLDLSGDADLLVAGGRRGAAAGAWTSTDGGETWAAVTDLATVGTGSADVVTVLADGSVAIVGAEVDDDSIATAWSSEDGRTFELATLGEDEVQTAYPYGMMETGGGLVLLDNAVRVWQSGSGRRWKPLPAEDGSPILLAPLHLPTGPVRLDDQTLVAVAIGDTVQRLISEDDGASWRAEGLDAPALEGAHLRRLVAGPGGTLYGAGFSLLDGAAVEEALLVRSQDDGRTWERIDLPGPGATGEGRQVLTSAVGFGNAVVALGAAVVDGERLPSAWLSVDDGETWSAIHPGEALAPRGQEAHNQGDSFEAAAVLDEGVVILGHRDDGRSRDISVWRLSRQ